MKSIHFTPDHNSFRATVRRYMENEVAPHAESWEAAGRIPRSAFCQLGDLGYLGICFPEEYGGSEADIFYALAFVEETARSMMGGYSAAVSVHQFMATAHIHKFGSPELKMRYLPGAVSGRSVGALGVTEPDTGSDVAAIRSRAERDGDHYIINGAKTFITNGAYADFITLAVKTQPDKGHGGVSLIVVDMDAPGVTVVGRLKKMGWYASDTAELAFQDVRVPVENLVGEENKGFYYIMDAFQLERLISAAMAVGICRVCMEQAHKYMSERTAFGHSLLSFQALSHRMADLATELEAAAQLTYHAAWLRQEGMDSVRECSMAKLMTNELAKKTADQCLQSLGGYGYMEEYPLARLYRDARAGSIVAGTSEIMRELIARQLIRV